MITQLRSRIINYIKSYEKPPELQFIGLELEHFIVRESGGRTVTYYEKDGIQDLLHRFERAGWKGHYENGFLLGLERGGRTITLEPGAQVEFSSSPCGSIAELEAEYSSFSAELSSHLSGRGQKAVASGYQPVSRIDEIPFIPKQKYHYMAEYFLSRGKLAHHMMKGTGSTQVTIDYTDEKDFSRKLRTACALSPVFSVLFSNAPVFEGLPHSGYSIRTKIWSDCDEERCGLIPGIFDGAFGYEEYADFLLRLKPIVYFRDGEYLFRPDQTFAELLLNEPPENIDAAVFEAMRMVFTDVRVKHFFELRMADALPVRDALGYAAFVREIFYNPAVFKEVCALMDKFSSADVLGARQNLPDHGPSAVIGKTTVSRITALLCDIVEKNASSEAGDYIKPVFERAAAQCGRECPELI